ncbi:hypothetical protein [Streptomyces sp. NPDC059389]
MTRFGSVVSCTVYRAEIVALVIEVAQKNEPSGFTGIGDVKRALFVMIMV